MPPANLVEELKRGIRKDFAKLRKEMRNRISDAKSLTNIEISDTNNEMAAVKNDVKRIANKIHELHNTATVTTRTTTTAEEQVVFISGGYTTYTRGIKDGGRLASTEIYPKIKTCSTPSLPKKNSLHALFMTAGTQPVLASCGGISDRYRSLDACLVFDADHQRWDEDMMSSLPQVRRDFSVVTLENVGVYAIGGGGTKKHSSKSTSDFLPANSLQWTRGPGLPKDVSAHAAGCAVIISKTSFIYINFGVIREYKIDVANPTSNQGWMPANRWPAISRRAAHTCARIGSYVLIAGGWGNGVGGLSSTKIIDIATRKVRLGGNLVTPRYNHNLATVTTGGLTKTFALGGNRSGGKYLSTVEEWDEDNLKWKPAGNLKVARSEFAAITVPLSVVCPGSG